MNEVLEIVRKIAEERGFKTRSLNNNKVEIIATDEVPISLLVVKEDNKLVLKLSFEGLGDYLREIKDSGEDLEDIINDALEDLKGLAVTITNKLRNSGISITSHIREGELDILDLLDEVKEEE